MEVKELQYKAMRRKLEEVWLWFVFNFKWNGFLFLIFFLSTDIQLLYGFSIFNARDPKFWFYDKSQGAVLKSKRRHVKFFFKITGLI